jgi:low affinity Fe/Cu permease
MVWAVTGPLLGFSNTWQLIINTATTIITFNMVFVIQNTQNRDGRAMHTKLDAILDHLDIDSEDLKGLEDLPEVDIRDRQERVRA